MMKTTFQSIIIYYSCSLLIILSGKQDSNLRPPASKTGKQPPLSFQLCRFTSIFFRETAGAKIFYESLRSMRESNSRYPRDSRAGYRYLNRPFCCGSERIRTSNPGFRKPMLYPVELRNRFK